MKTIKLTLGSAPPVEKMLTMALCEVVKKNGSTVRFVLESGEIRTHIDGEESGGPTPNLFPHIVKLVLGWAGIRIWPWTRKIEPKRINFETDGEFASFSFEVESQNIRQEITLTKLAD